MVRVTWPMLKALEFVLWTLAPSKVREATGGQCGWYIYGKAGWRLKEWLGSHAVVQVTEGLEYRAESTEGQGWSDVGHEGVVDDCDFVAMGRVKEF